MTSTRWRTISDWRWRLLAAAVLVQAGLSVAEMGLPLLVGFIKRDLHTSTALAGLIVSAYYFGKFIGSYLAGRISDRVGEIAVITAGAASAALLLMGAAFMPLGLLLPMLTIAGMAGAGSTPAGGRLVWQTFAPDRRGLALGIRQTGVPLGGVVAAATLPALANVTSWRTSIVTAALVALLSTIPLHAMRDRGRMAPVARSRERVRAINRDVRLLTVWGCLAMTGQFAVLTYMPLDAHQRAGLSLAAAASLAAVAQATGIAGRVLWGWLSDRGGHGGRNAQLLLLTVGSICAVGLVLLLPTGAPLALWVLCAAALGITVIGFQGLWLTMLTEVANPAAVGAATGFAVMCTIGSVTVTPPLFGAFADEFGTYRAVWVLLIAVLAVALVPILQLHKATSEATLQAAA